MGEWIGWLAAAILLCTVGSQVINQLRTKSTSGVSIWLYVGQVVASALFTVHAVQTEAWVFAAVNPITGFAGLVGAFAFWKYSDDPNPTDEVRAGPAG